MKMPAFQFYPADWRKDPGVQALSRHDRSVWFDMLCIMHESDERGVLLLAGRPVPEDALARMLNLDNQTFNQTLSNILTYGVASRRQSDGAIYSRRMVKDESICQVRREAGKKGGNPGLVNQKTKQTPTTGVNQIPTPSSSSSISSSSSEINPPLPLVEVAAPQKKIEGVEMGSKAIAPESPATELRTPGGAADVGTAVEPPEGAPKLTKLRGGKLLVPEPEHFAAFWQAYTRHDDRAGAVAAFRKLTPADQEAAAARAADWLAARPDLVSARGDFRPHPATWLNKTRWNDAQPTTPIQQSVNPQQHAVYPTGAKPGAAVHHVPVVASYGKL